MKRLVILSDSKHIPKVRNFLKNATVIATNLEVERHLKKENIKFRPIQNYVKLKGLISHILKGKNFIQNWIHKNQNFSNLLCYKNLHLFDLMEYNLSMHSDYYPGLNEIIRSIDLLQAIFKKEDHNEIIAVDDGNVTTEVLKIISKPILIKSRNFNYHKKALLMPPLASFLLKLKLYYGRIKPSFKNLQGKIITPAAGYYNCIIPILPLIKDMKEDFMIIRPLQLRTDNMVKMLKKEKIPFVPIENYLDKNLFLSIKHNTKRLIRNLNTLLKDRDFISSFRYNKVPIFGIFKKTLNCLLKRRGKILEAIASIELYKKILDDSNPRLILLMEEANLHSRTLLKLAKQQKIPVLHMQHGFYSEICSQNNYLSDKILVWGEAVKKNILKYNKYNDNDVLVTGKLSIKKDYDAKSTLNKLHIAPNKKIVTLATNNTEPDGGGLILETLNVTKDLDDVQLIIKLHPEENGKLQKKLVKLTKTNPIIIKNMDINELMNISDLVIVKFSTVGLFALEHHKPLISVDYKGLDEMEHIKSGAAIGVNKLKDLKNAIMSLLYDEQKKKELLEKTKPYLAKYLTDDNALEKTKAIIKKMIN